MLVRENSARRLFVVHFEQRRGLIEKWSRVFRTIEMGAVVSDFQILRCGFRLASRVENFLGPQKTNAYSFQNVYGSITYTFSILIGMLLLSGSFRDFSNMVVENEIANDKSILYHD